VTKRANGEGSIYRRSDGRWAAQLPLGSGRSKFFYGRTKLEVTQKLNAARHAKEQGATFGPELTILKFLMDWLTGARPGLRASTWKRYEELVRLHIVPTLGSMKLSKLTPQHVQNLYATLLSSGLSPATVQRVHACLHRALGQATRWGYTTRNVASLADPPRVRRHEMTTFTGEEARRFLDAASSDRLFALFLLAISTGIRQGEALALHWRDLDLGAATMSIRGSMRRTGEGFTISEPKSGKSRHILLTTAAVSALAEHRSAQLVERFAAGPDWHDSDLVFCNSVGRPLEVSNLIRRTFRPLLHSAEVPMIRFHDLRHTAATLLLGQGVHPKVVSEMLGHSQISITMDLYSHVTPTMQADAVRAFEQVLAG
jgi:integrase